MTDTTKTQKADLKAEGCGCSATCRCGDACACKSNRRCDEACTCAV